MKRSWGEATEQEMTVTLQWKKRAMGDDVFKPCLLKKERNSKALAGFFLQATFFCEFLGLIYVFQSYLYIFVFT